MTKMRNSKPAKRTCPICGKPVVTAHRPFCSPRCADVDLGHWLMGSYAVPSEERPDPDTPDGRDPD
ncbi:MAG: DNA gyrase inhibitor YacG [Pseudomonadota bacterium]